MITFCAMLYYAGIGIKEAQNLMGHSSADMVYDIYTHLDAQKENSLNSLNSYLKSWHISDTLFDTPNY